MMTIDRLDDSMTIRAPAPSPSPPPADAGRAPAITSTEIAVDVVSGETYPVCWLEVCAHYDYGGRIQTVRSRTDATGRATFTLPDGPRPRGIILHAADEVLQFDPGRTDRVVIEL